MIDLSKTFQYRTQTDKAVMLWPQTKMLHGKRVYVGMVEGERAYHHWDEDGNPVGTKDMAFKLKESNA